MSAKIKLVVDKVDNLVLTRLPVVGGEPFPALPVV